LVKKDLDFFRRLKHPEFEYSPETEADFERLPRHLLQRKR
jgi:hypothetical protein